MIVAEGAIDRNGNKITAEHVRQVLAERLQEDVRVTILGHVQRGGSPSAYHRAMSTLVGEAAVDEVLTAEADTPARTIGMKGNRVNARLPLMECVGKTHAINAAIRDLDFVRAMELRGRGPTRSASISCARWCVRCLMRLSPASAGCGWPVLTASALAPGMNTAVRAAVRVGVGPWPSYARRTEQPPRG